MGTHFFKDTAVPRLEALGEIAIQYIYDVGGWFHHDPGVWFSQNPMESNGVKVWEV